MSNDIKCPYCNEWEEINHDDGYGYNEEKLYNQECSTCDKIFTYVTKTLYIYEAFKADCLNGGDHKWGKTLTVPRRCTKMECATCEERREPTEEEWPDILSE